MDHTLKIWDVRNTQVAIESIYNLENNLPGCRISLSPDEKYILAGTSFDKVDLKEGTFKVFDSTTYK